LTVNQELLYLNLAYSYQGKKGKSSSIADRSCCMSHGLASSSLWSNRIWTGSSKHPQFLYEIIWFFDCQP